MQSRLDAHHDFELKINNNPIDLIKATQKTMHETARSQYPVVLIKDALNRLTNVKQFETEYLLDYVARSKKNCVVMNIHLRKCVLD